MLIVGSIDGPVHCVMLAQYLVMKATNAPNCMRSRIDEKIFVSKADLASSLNIIGAAGSGLTDSVLEWHRSYARFCARVKRSVDKRCNSMPDMNSPTHALNMQYSTK